MAGTSKEDKKRDKKKDKKGSSQKDSTSKGASSNPDSRSGGAEDHALQTIEEGKGYPYTPQRKSDEQEETTVQHLAPLDPDATDREVMNRLAVQMDNIAHMVAYQGNKLEELEHETRSTKKLTYSTAKQGKEKKKNKTDKKKPEKKRKTFLESMQLSAKKEVWADMKRNEAEDEADGDNDPSDGSSSESDSSSSSSSDSEGNQSNGGQNQDDGGNNNNNNNNGNKNGKKGYRKGSLFKDLASTTEKAAKSRITITRPEKECNVTISDFTLSHVCKAMRRIIRFQEVEGTLVNMAKVLSAPCAKHLKLKYSISNEDLINMDITDLFHLMAKETVVHSKPKFYTQLKEALEHIKLPDYQEVSPSNYENYYFEQLHLVEDFKIVFKIMLEENKEYCPNVDEKEYGLIRLFKSFHSHRYWSYAYATRPNLKYSKVDKFLEDYENTAMELYQISKVQKEMPWYIPETKKKFPPGKKYLDVHKENYYHRRKREISAQEFNMMKGAQLHHIDDEGNKLPQRTTDPYASDSGGDDTWYNAEPEKASKSQKRVDSDDEDSISQASNETEEDSDSDEQLLAAFGDHQPNTAKADKQDYPCLRKIMSGKCDRGDCPYGHRREVLLKGASDMIDKLKAYQQSQSTASNQATAGATPYRVLQKDKYKKSN